MIQKVQLFLVIFCLALVSCTTKKTNVIIDDLKCEYQQNPVGIDRANPLIQWKLNSTERGIKQTAYQIQVASSEELLLSNKADIWNSGKVLSDDNIHIEFAGQELKSLTDYFWKVKIWDQDGTVTDWSEAAKFQTALMSQDEWHAKWISRSEGDSLLSTLFRKEFTLSDKAIQKAAVVVTGLGNYVSYLNGKRLGNDLLSPGWTDYSKRLEYQTYDVTNLLKSGENALGAITGNMWWSSGLGWRGGARYSKGPHRILMQLVIKYEDGSNETITTDETWKWDESPVIYDHIYHGEHYDATLEQENWNNIAFDDTNWKNASLSEWGAKLYAQQAPSVRQQIDIEPTSIKEVKKGIYVFDFAQNVVGWGKLKIKANKGDKITIRYAELLHEDGTVAQENLRSAKATDIYIAKGADVEIWEPKFTYHGYRYIQIEGLSEKPDNTTIMARVIHADEQLTGSFKSSNELINQIYNNTVWGQRGNFMTVATDCPQRDERLGWMGDAQMFAPTANFNMNLERFWQKWLKDITDCQDEEGWVYDVNPAVVVGGPAKPGWGDAVTVVPWISYKYFGDTRIISENYDGMKAWVEYMRKKSKNDIYVWSNKDSTWFGYGDWIAPVSTPSKPIGTAYYFYSSSLLSKMAEIIGKTDDAKEYAALAEDIAKAYQAKYWDEETQNYEGGTQAANLLPLAFGITPDNLKQKVIENVANDVIERDIHPSTGFLGTGYILTMLSEYGYHDLAYKLMDQTTYPSWGYMVKNGATTIWELWNSDKEKPEGMNSRNHFALGGVCEWLFNDLGGINASIENPGFKHIIIEPKPVDDLDWVSAGFESNYGKVKTHWEKVGDGFKLDVTIPANTTATVIIPALKPVAKLFEGEDIIIDNGEAVSAVQNIKLVENTNESVVLEIGSGSYSFKY